MSPHALTRVIAASGGTTSGKVDLAISGWHWPVLIGAISVMLLVDLLLVHRRAHVVHTKEAAIESAVWISLGLIFGLVMLWEFGPHAAGEYIGGYLIEKSLSVDNVFVWAVLFAHFKVPAQYQHRVLFWGIFGALAMRLGFIFAGVAIINSFKLAVVVFGVFLAYTGAKLFKSHDRGFDPSESRIMRLFHRYVPSTDQLDGQRLFTRNPLTGRRLATPLFAVLIMVEIIDVVFAIDSVPAVLSVTREHYIAFASNAFAILGLRALYFLLADMRDRFRYLQPGLGVILVFVGVKMVVSYRWHMPIAASLAVIGTILTVSIVASVRADRTTA